MSDQATDPLEPELKREAEAIGLRQRRGNERQLEEILAHDSVLPDLNTPKTTGDSKRKLTLSRCGCGTPDLKVATDKVGPAFVQVIHCTDCDHVYGALVEGESK